MQFKVNKSEFLRGLKLAQSVSDRKNSMPILANVLIIADGESGISIAATDLSLSLNASIDSKNKSTGGFTADAKSIHGIVANLPNDVVNVKLLDNSFLEIKSGKVKFKLVGLKPDSFPALRDTSSLEFSSVDSDSFKGMLSRTMFSVSNDDTRFHLNGVLVDSVACKGQGTDNVRMVSTDGHRLSQAECVVDGFPGMKSVIPTRGLIAIQKVIDSSESFDVSVDEKFITVRVGGVTIESKLINAKFPDYEKIIPDSSSVEVLVGREDLLESLKRASLVCSGILGVKLSVGKDKVSIFGSNPDSGEFFEEIEATVTGDNISVGVNPAYVMDALSALASTNVTIGLNDALDPVSIHDTDFIGVVMPMRV